MNEFIEFTGEETEAEFLEKCYQQWEISSEQEPMQAMMQLGAMFSEMKHRIEELEDSQ